MRLLTLLTPLLAGLALAGCEGLFDDLDAGPLDAFRDAGPPADIGGTWKLTGSGRLSDCDDPRFETDSMRLSSTLEIIQDGGALRLADGLLLAERFVFEDGTVREDAVRFTTLEEGEGLRILLRFEGRYDALINEIRGSFEGEGPGTCRSAGSFTVVL